MSEEVRKESAEKLSETATKTEAAVGRKLAEDECGFLLANVDNPHSDYDEEAEGWVNYTIADDHLIVSHQDEAGEVVEGRWHLTFVGGTAKTKEA